MRKNGYFTILLLLVFFIRIPPAQGGYHVTAGESYYYDMVLAEVDITLGGTNYKGNGYSIAGHHVAQGTMCTLVVNTVGGTSVSSTLYGGGYSQPFTSEWSLADELEFPGLILTKLWKAQPFLTNPTLVPNGLGLIFYPFVDFALAFDFFEEFVDQTNYQLTLQLPYYATPTFKCISEEKDGLYYFESFFSANDSVSGGSPEYDLDFSLRLKFVYDRNLAILQGMHYLAKGKGTFNGQPAKYRCESLTEIQFYDLPNFKLSWFDMQYDWWILPVAIGGGLIIIGTVVFVSLRARKGKKPKKTKKKSTKKKKK